MALVALASAAAGVAVGFAAARVFTQRPAQTLNLQATEEPRALEQLRALQLACGISPGPSTPRSALALDGVEAARSLLEHTVVGPVLAGAVVDAQGLCLCELGAREYLDAAGAFSARLGGLNANVWRVTWRSAEGVELTAQRCPTGRAARWLVLAASGAPVDPVALTRVAAETGLLAQLEAHRPADVAPLGSSDLSDHPALLRLSEHVPLLMAGVWTTDGSGFDIGRMRVTEDVLHVHERLHRWSALVRSELGSSLGVCCDVGRERFCFHPVGDGAVLAVATPSGRAHPWQRLAATARQLHCQTNVRRAS